MELRKLTVRLIVRVRSHFALLFCRGWLWNVQSFTERTYTAFVLLIKPFVWRYSLTSWFAPDSVHTTPRNLKTHTGLFVRLGLRSRVICHENGAFQKRSSNRRNLKTPALSFCVERKHLKTDLFEHDRIRRTTRFPWSRSLQTKI